MKHSLTESTEPLRLARSANRGSGEESNHGGKLVPAPSARGAMRATVAGSLREQGSGEERTHGGKLAPAASARGAMRTTVAGSLREQGSEEERNHGEKLVPAPSARGAMRATINLALRRDHFFWLGMLTLVVLLNLLWSLDNSVIAQQPPAQTAPPKKAEPEKKAKDIPPARVVQLQTKPQGNILPINLSATWFAGVNDKDTVPVVLLHDWGSSNKSLMPLAQHLQKELGCAVLVPDLRGHGESTSFVGGGKKLDAKNMSKQEIPFATEDIEACKRFLKERHNGGELNIEMLTLIACGDTTALAATWAASDWQWPPYNGVKQGQDSKLLILLSPVKKFESFNLAALLKTPLFSDPSVAGITTVLVWDPEHAASEREASALETTLTKGLGPIPGGKDEERWSKIRYALKVVNGGGYGHRLLSGEKGDIVKKEITSFIDQKLASRAEKYPWIDRTEK